MAGPFQNGENLTKFKLKLKTMTREKLIKRTVENLTKLPDQRLKEVSDFAEFLLNRIENRLITEGIQKLTTDSNAFKFLEEDEDLYSLSDLKERYNG